MQNRKCLNGKGVGRIFGCFAVGALMIFARAADAQGQRALHGHVPEVVKHLAPISALPANSSLRLAIGLPLRNQDALTNLLHDLYDPSSPSYHQYLTPDQFAQQFGPSEQDYQAVIAFAKAHGLTVTGTHSSRQLLDVSGPVANIEQAFQINLHVYQHPNEPRTFFAPDTEPTVPANLSIQDIEGLNNYIIPHPKYRKEPAQSTTNAPVKVGSGPNGYGYMGSDFRTAYAPGVTNTGAGQSVALIEYDGFYTADITDYETAAHLSTSTPITTVLLNGFNGQPGGTSDGNEIEVALDIEMVLAMAPGIKDVYVYEDNVSDITNATLVNDMLDRIATDNSSKQISCSWIITINATSDSIFQQYAAQGQSFYNASGDDDAYIGDVPPPSDNPYMTQVGGTTLTTSGAGGPWSSETTWQVGGGNGSSGGVSPYYAMPSWQEGVNMTFNNGSPTQRNFPDVAAVADQIFIVANDGVQQSVGGTSCAAPLWAAYTALVNQQAAATGKGPVGFVNAALYNIALGSGYGSTFHDITTGNNTNSFALSEFYATNGYDLCTGLGTPNGGNLMNALLASPDALQVSPNSGFTATGPVGGPFNISAQTYTLTNSSAASLNWSSTSTASWLSVSPA
ncbi:MAG TPA: protease pro-enzyme activation domain-containing protein, partial [Verrucomicrobiae bacterium]|nr:protease pro-enzyme activation domain-containing protein [Verrucomicrobiae bacterium]